MTGCQAWELPASVSLPVGEQLKRLGFIRCFVEKTLPRLDRGNHQDVSPTPIK